MKRVVDVTMGKTRRFNLLGIDFSCAIGTFCEFYNESSVTRIGDVVNYEFDKYECNGFITYRLILWKIKLEMKMLVERNFVFA